MEWEGRSATSQAKGRRSFAVRAAKMAAVPVKAPRASTETATDIRPIFKLVPVVSPPRTFSKLRLINALMTRNLWPAVRDWLDATGYYDLFVAAQDFREDHPQFAAALAAARTRFSLPDSEIAALLAESAAD